VEAFDVGGFEFESDAHDLRVEGTRAGAAGQRPNGGCGRSH
jgi:hypothetical protein